MEIKMLKDARFSLDGYRVIEAKKGEIVSVPANCEGVAHSFIEKEYCAKYEAPKPVEKKLKAPSNKNTPSARSKGDN